MRLPGKLHFHFPISYLPYNTNKMSAPESVLYQPHLKQLPNYILPFDRDNLLINSGHGVVNGVTAVTIPDAINTGGNVRQPTVTPVPTINTTRTSTTPYPIPARAPPTAVSAPVSINGPTPARHTGPARPTAGHAPRHGNRPSSIAYKIRRISTLRRYCVPVTTVLLVLSSVVVIAILIKVVLDNYYYFCVKSFKFIPLNKWCDGQADCSGNEDEMRCVQKIDFGNLSTVRFTDSGSIVQLFSPQGLWSYICYDGFDANKAKAVCAQIGYSSDPSFSSVSAAGLNGLFSTVQVTAAGIQIIPVSGSACASGNVVSLRCIACGINDREKRIIGGYDSSIDRSPWQVSVQNMGQHVCGGSIIAPRIILTAAHCFQRSQQQVDRWRVEAGHSSLTYTFASPAEKIYVHAQYNLDLHPYDIAIIKLKYDLVFSETIQPVCLPGFDNNLPNGSPLLVTGWGYTSEDGGKSASSLQEVSVNLISSDTCNSQYNGQILDSMICAGRVSGGADACKGDSGGPLVFLKVYWEQVGVVSWGYGCGRPGSYGVYTRTVSYVPWIYGVMRVDQ
ncbi:transmembrane protease serine 4-like [Gastrophryne carolinensis]